MHHLDLFSGIGGFALAARRVGWDTIGFCEIEPYCQKVLRKHWPDVPIYDDVRELDGRAIGHVDIISGGYPCQPFSVAGQRRGEEDDRHVWPEFARLIREIKPAYVVCENVAGHISLGLDQVLSDLEGLGYTTETFVIPACAVDAPHRRDRIWIIAYAMCGQNGHGKAINKSALDEERNIKTHWKGRAPISSKARGDDSVANPDITFGEGNQCTERGTEKRTVTLDHCRWEPESSICRVVNGIPNRSHRLRALGNAIVPQVAEVIFRCINGLANEQ